MNTPLLTVIIPVYNTDSYLRRCLDSVCSQTYTNLDIICVDDGSTDDSSNILRKYAAKDSRITLITQNNLGQGVARNAALRIARGEWITGVDSDDYISPDMYEKLLTYTRDDVDIISCECESVGNGLVRDCAYHHPTFSGMQRVCPALIQKTNCYFVTKLWRKSFVMALGGKFAEGIRYEDAFFYFTIAPYARGIYYLKERLYYYWQRDESTMHDISERGAEHLDVLQRIFNIYRTKGLPAVFGETSPTRFELYLLQTYAWCALEYTPKYMHESLKKRSYKIAREQGLTRSYVLETAWLISSIKLFKLFFYARPEKVCFSFLGIPLLVFQIREDRIFIRIFGIKLPCNNKKH